jgi:hypothetical protein
MSTPIKSVRVITTEPIPLFFIKRESGWKSLRFVYQDAVPRALQRLSKRSISTLSEAIFSLIPPPPYHEATAGSSLSASSNEDKYLQCVYPSASDTALHACLAYRSWLY